jgi:phage I-like protein
MPMPKPQDSEKMEDFVKHFMADPVMMDEYPDEKQRYAIALEQWNKKERIAMKNLLTILKEIIGAPAEFQVLPEGRIEIEGMEPAILDEAAAGGVIGAFKARGNHMVIDYEHQTLADGPAPAAGWIKDLIWKGKEGLWAVVEWTKKAKEYLENREYRYFSPVMLVGAKDGRVVRLVNIALTNSPKINHLQPIVAKFDAMETKNEKEAIMTEKLRKLLGLAADAAEAKIEEAVTLLVNKAKDLETQVTSLVACKEILEALGAKADDGKEEVIRIVGSLKAPADVAKALSLEVAELKTKITAMEQEDLVTVALKEGKTSPEELDKWGRTLALKAPDQFRLIVLSRPAGSVIPVDKIVVAKDQTGEVPDDLQKSVNRMMGVDDATFAKYNK